MDMSIIIVNWNTKELVYNCLESIIKYTKDFQYEIILIDNASRDKSVEMIQLKFPSVILIKNKENVGFSCANNQGIRIAKGKYTMLLNSDTYIKDNAFLHMMKFMEEKNDVGICGPKVLNPDLTPQPTRIDQYKPFDSFLKILGLYNYQNEIDRMDYDKIQEVEVVGGCCMLFKKKVFESIGLMEESFFLYNEENDICLRASKKKWKIVFFPVSIIFHIGGSSISKKEISRKVERACYKSNIYFYKKNFSKQAFFLLYMTYKFVFVVKLLELSFSYVMSLPSKKVKIKEKIESKWSLLLT